MLIADPIPLNRSGLKAILSDTPDIRIMKILEWPELLVSCEEIKRADQVLIGLEEVTDNSLELVNILLNKKPGLGILIYARQKNIDEFQAMIGRGVRGYILQSDPVEVLIESIRSLHRDLYSISPALSPAFSPRRAGYENKRVDFLRKLTRREKEIATLLAQGNRTGEIGALLGVKVNTVNKHLENIRRKIGKANIPGLYASILEDDGRI